MRNFWDLSGGEELSITGVFDTGGGTLEPIPNNTTCIAAIEEPKWDSYEGDEYISLKWRVMQPGEYSGRVIFQKIRVMDSNQTKADKAKRMLAAIDANAGGKLFKLGKKPDNTDLMACLVGKPMAIKVMVWEIDSEATGEKMKGNWISAVAPVKPSPKAEKPSAPEIDDTDDDIPF